MSYKHIDLASYEEYIKHAELNCDTVNKICHPLFKNSPITFFEYSRFYDKGEVASLITDSHVNWQIYKNFLTPRLIDFQFYTSSGLKVIYLSHGMPLLMNSNYLRDKYNSTIAIAADQQLYHRLYIIERRTDYYLIGGYGTTNPSNEILTYYLNAMPFLERFIPYFEFHADEIINTHFNAPRIIVPDYLNQNLPPDIDPNIFLNLSFPDITIPNTKNNSIDLSQFNMTRREHECIEFLTQGYTMKNIARKLDISPRTVEMHIRNVKEKYKVNTRNELIDKLKWCQISN